MKRLTLGDVCKKASSNIAQKDLLDRTGPYPIFGASGLIKQVDFYHQDKEYIAVVKDGAGIGRAMLLPAYSSVIGTMQYLFPKTEAQVDTKYLYYAIEHMNLAKYFSGATIPHIYFKDYQKEPINIPKIDEQRKISRMFEKIDMLIESRKKQLSKLDQIIKSRFMEMFGDPEHNTNDFPIVKLGSLCNVGSSKRIYQSEQSVEGVPFLRISDLFVRIDKELDMSNLYISDEKYEELCDEGLVPSVGDILITSRGTLGKCYIIKETDRFYFQDGMISWLSDISEKITSLYLSYLFSMAGIQKQITNLQAGSTVAYLSIAMLKKLDIMIPSLELQKQFAAFVSRTDKSKYPHNIVERKWNNLKTIITETTNTNTKARDISWQSEQKNICEA